MLAVVVLVDDLQEIIDMIPKDVKAFLFNEDEITGVSKDWNSIANAIIRDKK